MDIIPLFSQIDDAFIACEKQSIPSQLPQIPDAPKINVDAREAAYQRSHDDPCCFSSKSVSNVEALLPKARLPLLALGVPKTRQL